MNKWNKLNPRIWGTVLRVCPRCSNKTFKRIGVCGKCIVKAMPNGFMGDSAIPHDRDDIIARRRALDAEYIKRNRRNK